ncbi:hypothetical protein ACHAXR_008380 [Thalassiosira sp. AJA248-18]
MENKTHNNTTAPLQRLSSKQRVVVSRRDIAKHEMKINFLNDDPSTMTYARRAALHLMKRYRWYNPQLSSLEQEQHQEVEGHITTTTTATTTANYIEMDDEMSTNSNDDMSFNRSMRRLSVAEERPSLEKAWAYFEHVTLPRYLDHSSASAATLKKNNKDNGTTKYGSLNMALPSKENHCLRSNQNAANWEKKSNMLPESDNDKKSSSDGSIMMQKEEVSGVARSEKRNHLLSRWAVLQRRMSTNKNGSVDDEKQSGVKPFISSSNANKNNSDSPEEFIPYSEMCNSTANYGEEVLLDLSEPGEDQYPTKLYSPLHTPVSQMGDFGLGIGLYFTALRSITLLSFIAGLINIPTMMYFASEEYSQGQEGVGFALKGSAVCTVQEFVPCPTCRVDDFADVPHRIATAASAYGGDDLIFVIKNYCDGAKLPLATVNFATLLFVIYGMVRINRYLNEQEVKFDEDEQTAQDYSVVIRNPPPDATDPEEWKAFFDNNFGPNVHVTCCTIARDNHFFVRALVRRREILQRIKWKLQTLEWELSPLDMPSLERISKDLEDSRGLFGRIKSLVLPDVPALFKQLVKINEKVKQLASLDADFPATRVFLTFETEGAQRKILSHLSVGPKAVRRDEVLKIANPNHLFRSKLVLNAKEADEPSTIRWQDLSDRFWDRMFKMLLTAYAWACAMVLVALVVRHLRHRSSTYAAYAIAFFNSAFPEYAKLLVNFESHPSEGKAQTSLFVKIAAFRWINTAIIVTMITPFSMTLSSGGILDGVRKIFLAEIVTSNVIKIGDPAGFIARHYLAPRSGSQEEMNSHMRGQEWHLAERYTDMTKILFLTLWYCSIYPFGFFLCALALSINYFVERFSLMRTWRRAPQLGSSISSFSRRYFFTPVISAMAVASSYSWAGFPYDNLCENDNDGGDGDDVDSLEDYVGSWDVVSVDGSKNAEVIFSEGDPSYQFCQQSLWYGEGFVPYWQKEGHEWMTKEQELLSSIYGWTSFCLLVGVCLWILKISIRTVFYRQNYQTCGEDQGIPFSDVAAISSYLPEVKSDLFSYALLAVNTDDVEEELYEWKDPDKPYVYYDLTRDARQVLSTMPEGKINLLFSTVKHWPPNPNVPSVQSEEHRPEGSFC